MQPFDAAIERDQLQRIKAQKRIRLLAILTVMVVTARIFIKNPEPPKKAVHHNKPVRALPGMLARMPASERAKLSPEMVAKLQEADRTRGLQAAPTEVLVKKPTAADSTTLAAVPKSAREEFSYEEAPHRKQPETPEIKDIRKTTLVMLRNGRHIKAESAAKNQQNVEIVVSNVAMVARLPANMVASISENALTWHEPVPAGFVQLRPAKGITIQVEKDVARRITIRS